MKFVKIKPNENNPVSSMRHMYDSVPFTAFYYANVA